MKDHWALMLFAMEKLRQSYDVVINMSYIDLTQLIRMYFVLNPNKKKEKLEMINRIKQDFDPVDEFGWKRK